MRHLRTLPVVLLLSVIALSGCSSGASKDGTSTASSADTTSAASTASDSPSSPSETSPSTPAPTTPSGEPGFPRDRIEAASLHTAVLGQSVAKTREEKAVVDAWMAFWQGTADTYYYYRPTKAFDAVARKDARRSILGYLSDLKKQDQRVVGWAKDNITSVEVTGNTATVRDCTENFTFTVDKEIEPLTRPTPFYDATGKLEKVDGVWTVVKQSSKDLNKSCLS